MIHTVLLVLGPGNQVARNMYRHIFMEFLRADKGATAVEYGIIVGLISVASILAWMSLGDSLTSVLEFIRGKMAV